MTDERSCVRPFYKAGDIMPTFGTVSLEHEVSASHGTRDIDDGNSATAMRTVDIRKQLHASIDRDSAPELCCLLRQWGYLYVCHRTVANWPPNASSAPILLPAPGLLSTT